jgi:hypothetical protein
VRSASSPRTASRFVRIVDALHGDVLALRFGAICLLKEFSGIGLQALAAS